MEDVAPLARDSDRHLPDPLDPPEHTAPTPQERDRDALRELDALIAGEGEFEEFDSEDVIDGHVRGVDPRVPAQLRNGEFVSQAELDLHGHGVEAAHARLERFLLESHGLGRRCVRVVHGRGRNSPGGVPVLKARMPRWLSRGVARDLVLAYATAPEREGGAGATLVLLRAGGARSPHAGRARRR